MATRKLKNGGRCKATFGAEAGAILAAAGINVAGTMAASAIGANATKKAAQDQAKATIQSAQRQAQAIKDQSERARETQLESQEFIKDQNAQNRELQKDIQLQLQMLTGQQNVNDRLEASKIQVKNGGSTKRKLRRAGNATSSLQGGYNMPFVVTDGGEAIPVGKTPEGYDIYELAGNDHEHYHKSQGGKNKTGVGIKFADGSVIEGEGNQNSNSGEIMVDTPDNAYFLSKHSIKGFNPAKMAKGGMHPLQAYAIQESIKLANGISDDGKNDSTPVEKKLLGGQPNILYTMYNQSGPQPGMDTIGDAATGIVYKTNTSRSLKKGGCVRRKAWRGQSTLNRYANDLSLFNPYADRANVQNGVNVTSATSPVSEISPDVASFAQGKLNANTSNTTSINQNPIVQQNPTTKSGGFGNWLNRNADLVGSGLSALGNVGGALLTSAANRSAANTMADAYSQASGIVANAYNSLEGIDMNSIRREDYAAAHAMPALQAPVSQAANPNAKVDRALHRRLSNAGKYSSSGAAAQERMAKAEVDAQDLRNQIYSADQQQIQQIREGNVKRISEAATENARLDTAANQAYAEAYNDLLQYNNNIRNSKILGAAGALSEGMTNNAQTMSQAQTSNAAAWAQALTGSTQGFANSLSNMATRKADLEKVMLGASGDSQASYYANPRLSTKAEATEEYNRLKTQYDSIVNSNNPADKDEIAILKRRINNIASSRNLKLV